MTIVQNGQNHLGSWLNSGSVSPDKNSIKLTIFHIAGFWSADRKWDVVKSRFYGHVKWNGLGQINKLERLLFYQRPARIWKMADSEPQSPPPQPQAGPVVSRLSYEHVKSNGHVIPCPHSCMILFLWHPLTVSYNFHSFIRCIAWTFVAVNV